MPEGRLAFLWLGIHEPDEVDAVLAVLEELPADALADIAGSDYHCVLDVGERPTRRDPSCGPAARNAHDAEDPEEQDLLHIVGRVARHDGKAERPGRNEKEDSPEVVER